MAVSHEHTIWLVDDNSPTNFLHRSIIDETGLPAKVTEFQMATEALDALEELAAAGKPGPELMLLDINMPAMTGWEFLRRYEHLSKAFREAIRVVMLTTSLNPDDQSKADNENQITGFMNKPLTLETFGKIADDHFNFKSTPHAS